MTQTDQRGLESTHPPERGCGAQRLRQPGGELGHQDDDEGHGEVGQKEDHGPAQHCLDRGAFDDLPYDEIYAGFRAAYPKMFAETGCPGSDFEREAAEESEEESKGD